MFVSSVRNSFSASRRLSESQVICSKDKLYQVFEPTEFELSSGICLWVVCELDENVPLTNKYFNKYFCTIEEMRNKKINNVLE